MNFIKHLGIVVNLEGGMSIVAAVSSGSRGSAGACCDPPRHLCTRCDCSTVDRVQIIAGSRGRGGCGYLATHLLVMGSLLSTTNASQPHSADPLMS